jgi:hypothetical protein
VRFLVVDVIRVLLIFSYFLHFYHHGVRVSHGTPETWIWVV